VIKYRLVGYRVECEVVSSVLPRIGETVRLRYANNTVTNIIHDIDNNTGEVCIYVHCEPAY
jgi:hypothetical protein